MEKDIYRIKIELRPRRVVISLKLDDIFVTLPIVISKMLKHIEASRREHIKMNNGQDEGRLARIGNLLRRLHI